MLQDYTSEERSFEIRKKSSQTWILPSVSGLRRRQISDKSYRLIRRSISWTTQTFFKIKFPPFLSISIRGQLKSPATTSSCANSAGTVLCKSNANIFRRNSWLFLAFRWKNIEFSMKANLQRKVTIIRDAYCFQLREFLNDNSLGTKIDFEFMSENSPCLINDLEHLSEISLFICSAQTFPRIFWTIICLVWICRDSFFDVTSHCKLYNKLVSLYTTGLYKTHLYYFKGSL